MSSNYLHHEMFPMGADATPYRLLTRDHVGTRKVDGREILGGGDRSSDLARR